MSEKTRKIYYTAYQGNIYGIAVPADSPVKKMTDLKGKNIGVIAMGSAGVQIARALAATNGMDPERDINVVVAGEGAQNKWGVIKEKVDARDLISNELIGEINNFDPNKIAAEAKAYKFGK